MKRQTFRLRLFRNGPKGEPRYANGYAGYASPIAGLVIHRRAIGVNGEPSKASHPLWDVSHAVSGMRVWRCGGDFALRREAVAFVERLATYGIAWGMIPESGDAGTEFMSEAGAAVRAAAAGERRVS